MNFLMFVCLWSGVVAGILRGFLSTTGVYFNLYARAMGHGGRICATEKEYYRTFKYL